MKALWRVAWREVGIIARRPLLWIATIAIPLFSALFMTTVFGSGAMHNIPIGVVDEDFTTENRYGREIDEKYPNIKYTLPYRDPVYAIVSMDEKGITVKGTKSEFVGPDDDEIGLYTKPGSWWTMLYGSEFRASASQQDRYLPFD